MFDIQCLWGVSSRLSVPAELVNAHCGRTKSVLPSARKRRVASKRLLQGFVLGVVLAAVYLSGAQAHAQPSDAESKLRARDHFDRGLKLFNQLDNEGALAEFKQAYELTPHVLVLQNIGLVYAAMGRPVEAVDTLDRVLIAPTGLTPEALRQIQQERERQQLQIAVVELTANAPGAIVEVDGVETARTPLAAPLRIARGSHVIAVIAPGFIPQRRRVDLPGAAPTTLHFELVPTETALSHLEIRSLLPGIDLYLDGEFVGQTPLPTSLTITPGIHRFEGRRAGYLPIQHNLELGVGATGSLVLEPETDAHALRAIGGEIVLRISEPDALVFIDGKPHGAYSTALTLAPGAHVLRVERAEFFPVTRTISVVPRGRTEYTVELKPTPDKLDAYRASTRRRAIWGWSLTSAGVLVAAGSAGFLLYNSTQKSEKKSAFDAQVRRADPGGECDPTGVQVAGCRTELELALDALEQARNRDLYGWIGLGIGGAALGTGLFLLLGNNDSNRYSPSRESDVFAGRTSWKLALHPSGSSGIAWSLRF